LKRTNDRSSCIELARSHALSDRAHDQHLIRLSRFATEGPGDAIRPPRLGTSTFITASGKGCDEDIRGAPGRLLSDPAELPTAREPRRPISP
jgi:hypothetical protein